MTTRPRDTTEDAWAVQQAAHSRLGPEGRVRAAIELSEAIRAIQLAGILDRHPGWSMDQAVRHLVAQLYGVHLPAKP